MKKHLQREQMEQKEQKQGKFPMVFDILPPSRTNDPKVPFNNNNFKNNNNLRHNNLGSNLLAEEVREYSVMIDSKDRNYQVYPDPFNYRVKFHPPPKTREYINGKYVSCEEPAPTINDNFINVKYIKLEDIILPLYTDVRMVKELDEDENMVDSIKIDINKSLVDYPYVVLSIGKFSDPNYKSTNDVLSDSFATIYYGNKINNTHYTGRMANGMNQFSSDKLAKIDSFEISFMDPYGNSIRCPHVNKEIKSNMVCNCIDPTGDDDTDCFKHNLFHPLNPIFQHHLHFKIGVVEGHLNKMNFN